MSKNPDSPRKTNHIKEIIKNGLFFKHPVLVQGLALAPALIASTSVKNALSMFFCLLCVSMPSMIFSSVIKNHLPKWARVMFYCLISSAFYIPTYMIITAIYPEAYFNLGVFLPLIVVSSFIYTRSEKYANRASFFVTFVDGLANNIGFGLFACFLGAVREIFGSGKIWGIPLNIGFKIDALLLPFTGFILAGFCAAFIQHFSNKLRANRVPLTSIYGKEDESND